MEKLLINTVNIKLLTGTSVAIIATLPVKFRAVYKDKRGNPMKFFELSYEELLSLNEKALKDKRTKDKVTLCPKEELFNSENENVFFYSTELKSVVKIDKHGEYIIENDGSVWITDHSQNFIDYCVAYVDKSIEQEFSRLDEKVVRYSKVKGISFTPESEFLNSERMSQRVERRWDRLDHSLNKVTEKSIRENEWDQKELDQKVLDVQMTEEEIRAHYSKFFKTTSESSETEKVEEIEEKVEEIKQEETTTTDVDNTVEDDLSMIKSLIDNGFINGTQLIDYNGKTVKITFEVI